MTNDYKKTLIIYHSYNNSPCPDGHAAAWVALKQYPSAALLPMTYDKRDSVSDKVYKYERVVIVDFSFSLETLTQWKDHGIEVELIDHHKTAMDDLSSLSKKVLSSSFHTYIDLNESGATLAWKVYFGNKPMPTFLKYIKDRDLWEHKLPYTHEVYAAFGTLGRTFALYDILEDKSEDELIELLVPVGKRVLDDRKKIVDYIASRFEHKTVAGYKNIPVVTIKPGEEVYISDVCESLYLQFPDAPFSACVLDGTKYSLRSNKNGNNTNVASIAKQFGGGGHTNSAGFTVKE